MNALVQKEIRLLRPAWLVVLALEIVLPWFGDEQDHAFTMAPIFFFFGMILLAVDSFGREFSLGTFSSLMAQPIERRRLWRTKITALLFSAALIFAAFFASCWLRLHLALAENPPTWRNLEINAWHIGLIHNFQQNMAISTAVMFVALTGGLWTTLLFRQIAAAFWITFLAPAGLLMATLFFLPSDLAANDHIFTTLLYSLAALYAVWGFWLAHRLFHRAQDAGWTGGVVSFSRWLYFESGSKSSGSTRHRKPVVALIKKEFQLQSISWFCAAVLLVLHVAVVVMRYVHGSFSFERDSVASVTSEFFWTIWLVMPLIISSTTVAEERRLGVTEGQFCQPVSRRLQFVLKFFPAIISGLLLGGLMPLLLEGIAAAIGAPNPDFNSFYNSDSGISSAVIGLSLGLSLAAFYASTLTKSFMQAMGIAVIVIIGCCLFTSVFGRLHGFFGIALNPSLTISLTVLTVLGVAPTLTYRNFKYVQEHGRVWRRNAFGLTGAILFIFMASAVLYNRAWEVFEPAEPAHGPAILSLANPPTLRNNDYDLLQVGLPDGRVWFGDVVYSTSSGFNKLWMTFVSPFSINVRSQRFLTGSNWVSVTGGRVDFVLEGKEANPSGDNHVRGYLDTIGVQKDGTLWISNPNHGQWTGQDMIRFGDGTNWQQVIRSYSKVFILKNNGTLWQWGTNHLDWSDWQQHWPSLRTSQLYQLGTNSDWKELAPYWGGLAQKADGSVWSFSLKSKALEFKSFQATNLDQASLKTLTVVNNNAAYIRKDGTLWLQWQYDRNGTNADSDFERVGTETNWIAVALHWDSMVALKSDGSIWCWNNDHYHPFTAIIQQSPTRLGIHSDWVAIATSWQHTITLAADGSLWFWPDRENIYPQPLLKLPKQPQFLGNVFGKGK